MTIAYYVVIVLHVIACLFLIGVVLLQQGKNQDLASAFGGGGTQTAFGPARLGQRALQGHDHPGRRVHGDQPGAVDAAARARPRCSTRRERAPRAGPGRLPRGAGRQRSAGRGPGGFGPGGSGTAPRPDRVARAVALGRRHATARSGIQSRMERDPYHEGEKALQRRAGVREQARAVGAIVEDTLFPAARAVPGRAAHAGRGLPGRRRPALGLAPHGRSRLRAGRGRDAAPHRRRAGAGRSAGGEPRRPARARPARDRPAHAAAPPRERTGGPARRRDLPVGREVYGNCPKYIRPREIAREDAGAPARRAGRLRPHARPAGARRARRHVLHRERAPADGRRRLPPRRAGRLRDGATGRRPLVSRLPRQQHVQHARQPRGRPARRPALRRFRDGRRPADHRHRVARRRPGGRRRRAGGRDPARDAAALARRRSGGRVAGRHADARPGI